MARRLLHRAPRAAASSSRVSRSFRPNALTEISRTHAESLKSLNSTSEQALRLHAEQQTNSMSTSASFKGAFNAIYAFGMFILPTVNLIFVALAPVDWAKVDVGPDGELSPVHLFEGKQKWGPKKGWSLAWAFTTVILAFPLDIFSELMPKSMAPTIRPGRLPRGMSWGLGASNLLLSLFTDSKSVVAHFAGATAVGQLFFGAYTVYDLNNASDEEYPDRKDNTFLHVLYCSEKILVPAAKITAAIASESNGAPPATAVALVTGFVSCGNQICISCASAQDGRYHDMMSLFGF